VLRRPDLPACRLLAAKHHTSTRRFRDQSVLLVGYVAFNVADGAATLHNGSFRSELCLPDRAKEIDFQFDGSEGFLRRKSACERHPHCRIGNITEDSAVQRPHGICMLRSGCQHDGSTPISNLFCLKSNQTGDGYVVDPCSLPKVGFQRNSLSTHELRALPLDFRARTLVSRYSSRRWQARSSGSSFRCRRVTMKLPSRVLAISVANFAELTSERTSPRRFPSSAIDCRRSSHEPRACRAFARN